MASSTFDSLLKDCPEFRVLISGRAGVGKTTLIMETFQIETLQASHKDPGECDIEDEIRSPDNKLFICHDSKGFEPGEIDNFNRVKAFIESRAKEPLIKNRLHAVWLCLQIPVANGRLLEAGDEEFLKLPFVPVIIVFTKYDLLYSQIFYQNAQALAMMNPTEREELITAKTKEYFHKNCVKKIEEMVERPKNLGTVWVSTSKVQQYQHTLVELVEVTLKQLSNVQGSDRSTWIVSAAAQRVNADAKVASCIEVGIRKYWRDLAAGIHFANQRLRDCIDVIHNDIIGVWNFRDEGKILQKNDFIEAVCLLIDDLANPHGRGPNSDQIKNQRNIKETLATATPIGAPIGLLMKWLAEKYTKNPDVLRCLMGYIVDVTILLEILFWRKVAQPHRPSIGQEDIDAALEIYQGKAVHVEVHLQIRNYVANMKLPQQLNQGDQIHLEIKNLINSKRRNLPIDAIFSYSPTKNTGISTTVELTPTTVEPTPTTIEPAPRRPPEAGQSTNPPAKNLQPSTIKSEISTPDASGSSKKNQSGFMRFFRKKL